jgi:hypothetical protein
MVLVGPLAESKQNRTGQKPPHQQDQRYWTFGYYQQKVLRCFVSELAFVSTDEYISVGKDIKQEDVKAPARNTKRYYEK